MNLAFKRFILSLFRSACAPNMRLAVLLCNWDFKFMRELLIGEDNNPSDEYYVAFGADGDTLTIANTLLENECFYMEIPEDKRTEKRLLSWCLNKNEERWQ